MTFGTTLAIAIGARMHELRKERRLTLAEVARRTGIHRPIVSRLESGRHLQGLREIGRIAAALQVDVRDIVEAIDDAVDSGIGALADAQTRAANAVSCPSRRPSRERRASVVLDRWLSRQSGAA